ncbi:MAG: Flp family type IVb pilin [Candidatus Melainabacteria bacterium]|nr:Flp family type IVb pilin [Candidatus Melainabacteria bacterium]
MLKHYIRLKTKGQSLAEYGLILALVAVFCIIALQTLGTNISAALEFLASEISGAIMGA